MIGSSNSWSTKTSILFIFVIGTFCNDFNFEITNLSLGLKNNQNNKKLQYVYYKNFDGENIIKKNERVRNYINE